MTRLLFFLALAVFGLIAARRWTQKIGQGKSSQGKSQRPPRSVRVKDNSVASVICATCRTEYRPDETAWQCPTCQR